MNEQLKELAGKDVDRQRRALVDLSHAIHAEPELAFAEYHGSSRVASYLSDAGFAVRSGICQLPTAFAAEIGEGALHVALFAEYDALPDIGHACGHNIVSAISAGAAVALASLTEELGITLTVFGTPAEERGAGKVLMLDRGAFAGVHVGLMVHPGPFDALEPQTTALGQYEIIALGRGSHAAAAPFLGVNAADAILLAQTAIGLLRQHLPPGDHVHGIVTSAGSAPNIIPDRAVAEYILRAPNVVRLGTLETRIRACFAGGGMAAGARIQMTSTQPLMHELHSDPGLLQLWATNHAARRRPAWQAPPVPISTDLGSVSAKFPCIHPIIGIQSWPAVNHQPGFAAAAAAAPADEALQCAAATLAETIIDLATDPAERGRFLNHAGITTDVE